MSGGRQSFVQQRLEPRLVIQTFFRFGFKSFGTMHDQIESFHYKFVDQLEWLNDTQYKEIVNVCQSLPGPIANQILILIATLTTKSPGVGFLAFAAFCLPSAILLCILGLFMDAFVKNYSSVNVYIRLTVLGCKAAGGALLVRRASDALKQYVSNIFAVSIIVTSAILYFLFPSTACIDWCFIFGVIISLYVKTEKKSRLSKNAKLVMKNMRRYSWIFGKWAVIILVGLYAYLGLSFRINQKQSYYFAYTFYFVGCFVFGPSTTLFPLLYPAFLELEQMEDHQFWFGVPISFLVPGSPTNVAIYYGTVLYGVAGGFLAWLFLHIPSFLIVYGILPSWDEYRERAGIQRIIIGMNCVSLGFLFSAGLLALNHAVTIDYGIPIILFILSLFLSVIGIPNYIIIIAAGLLANARRWGLVDFRGIQPPDY